MSKALSKVKMFVFVAVICWANLAWSQEAKQVNKNFKKEPHWITMMADPQINYFEASKAFEEFWENRHAPSEEEEWEITGITKRKSFLESVFRSKDRSEGESNKYIVEYRQFKMWQQSVQAYIKADGTLLSIEERLQLWKKLRDQPVIQNH